MQQKLPKNTLTIALIRALTNDFVTFGIFITYMISQGLTLLETSTVVAAWTLTSAISQTPAGMFADRYGLKKSIIIGTVLCTIGLGVVVVSNSLLIFSSGYALFGLGSAFVQGADVALLYDGFAQLQRKKEFKKTFGRILFWSDIYAVCAAIIGGLLFGLVQKQVPFLVQAILTSTTIFLALSLRTSSKVNEAKPLSMYFENIFKKALYTKYFSRTFILSAIIGSTSIITFQYLQPLYQEIHIPEVYFGALAAGAFLMRGVGGRYADSLGKYLPIDKYLMIHCAAFALFLFSLSQFASAWLIIPSIAIMFFLRGLYIPTVSTFINNHVDNDTRATMLSLNDQLLFITTTGALLIAGLIAEVVGLNMVFFVIGMLSIIYLIVYLLFVQKITIE